MRDATFTLIEPLASAARPPFRYAELLRSRPPFWTIRDAANGQVGTANTRAGARAGVRALYATAERS